MSEIQLSPAEVASEKALSLMYEHLEAGRSFRLEAGAGAGKTYSLIKALEWLIENKFSSLSRQHQSVACITYTNAAKDEIKRRIDGHALVKVSTIHSFCWSLISGFQRQIIEKLSDIGRWSALIDEHGDITHHKVDYNLGVRFISDKLVSLHHDDVIPLTLYLMDQAKFRQLMSAKFPIILIDEYQDTNDDWVQAIKQHFLDHSNGPQFGFFGDHWQKIYGSGCGKLNHSAVAQIDKNANFRSNEPVVECLNRMRPELQQFSHKPGSDAEISVFHTNDWNGERRPSSAGGHWTGDLPAEDAHAVFSVTQHQLADAGWDFDSHETKVLMLTHKLMSQEQGYSDLASTFRYSDDFLIPEHPFINFFFESLEPALEAYSNNRFGEMMACFSSKIPPLRGSKDKAAWSEMMDDILSLAKTGSVGEIYERLKGAGLPIIPDSMKSLANDFEGYEEVEGEKMPRRLQEYGSLCEIPYIQVQALVRYLKGFSPFETKHGVKGLEYENVLVVIGRGWNKYNFDEMLGWVETGVPKGKEDKFERNRNLFYVCCSRAKKRLVLLFTQELSDASISTLRTWFGEEAVRPAVFESSSV